MSFPLYVREASVSRPIPPESYVSRLAAVHHLVRHPLVFKSPVTILVGENGTGKSTLMEAIAVALGFNPEGGSRHFNFSTNDTHSCLGEHLRIAKGALPRDSFFLRAESFYNVASYVDGLEGGIYSYGNLSLHARSHGESFMALMEHRLRGNGLYLFDEPEAALSPSRILTLMCHIHNLVEHSSQFIISTHSPILMAYPDADILQIDNTGIHRVNWKDTEHYQITRLFLENPERMLRHLFSDTV